jgi:SWIM zinc finger
VADPAGAHKAALTRARASHYVSGPPFALLSSPSVPTPLASDQILALAPDPASAKAGAALATPRKWVRLGRDGGGRTAWGECQGSGAQPYQTQADLDDLATRCSCPSRKFPCKHALGLLLLLAAEPGRFATGEPPAWVAEWLASREQRAGRRAAKQEEEATEATQERSATRAQPADLPAQTKRAAARAAKVERGLAELSLWLRDLVRGGLAAAPSRPAAFWDAMAARLVDAQAPGAARMVRQLGALPATGEGWPERMLAQLGRLHLLVEAYGRLEQLPEPTQADVRAQVGWTLTDADLAGEPGVADRWTAIGQALEEEERLRVRRTWLYGHATGRVALLLHFAHGTAPFGEHAPPVGATLAAELVFHPGAYPLRAAVRSRGGAHPDASLDAPSGPSAPLGDAPLPPGHPTLADATATYAASLAANPWVERVPLVLDAAVPELSGARWHVRDARGDALPLAARFRAGWTLLALSGGHPVWLCGEWDGDALFPLAAAAAGSRPVALLGGAGASSVAA